MKKLFTIATLSLVLSTSAFAATVTIDDNTKLSTDTYSTKMEAYNAGFDIKDNLTVMTEHQLRNQLPLSSEQFARDFAIDDTKVTVSEFATARGDISYSAIVDVNYHYSADENEND
jgi:hypothetical protein